MGPEAVSARVRTGLVSRLTLASVAAWLVLAPALRAEDAVVPGEEPEPVILLRPANGTAIPGGGRPGAGIALAWRPSRTQQALYFVEVIASGSGEPQEMFTAYTRQTELRVRLDDAGRYAWRVLAVNRASAHYSVSAWWSFTLGDTR